MLEKMTSLLLILSILNLIRPNQCCKKDPNCGRFLSFQCKRGLTPSNVEPISSFSEKTVIIGDMELTKDQYESSSDEDAHVSIMNFQTILMPKVKLAKDLSEKSWSARTILILSIL